MMVSWTLLPFLMRNRQRQQPSATVTANNQLVSFPNEVFLEVISHLDAISMFRLTRVSASCRYLLITHYPSWTHIYFDPRVPVNKSDEIRQLLGLVITQDIHKHISSLRLDGCSIQATTLELLLRNLPSLQYLSIIRCPRLDCFQFLAILERAFFIDRHQYSLDQPRQRQLQQQQTAPIMLRHLRRLDMRGLFPSEQEVEASGSTRACAREMYCFGAIKQILAFPFAVPLFFLTRPPLFYGGGDGIVHSAHAAALYHQFWLLLHQHQHYENIPSSLGRVMMDVAPCPICRRHIAPNGVTTTCKSCGDNTLTPCQQCICHPCRRVLCGLCFARRQGWQIAHCGSCRLFRRVCETCHLGGYPSVLWTCQSCCNRRGHHSQKMSGSQDSRGNTNRLLSSLIPWSSFLLPPQHPHPHPHQPPF